MNGKTFPSMSDVWVCPLGLEINYLDGHLSVDQALALASEIRPGIPTNADHWDYQIIPDVGGWYVKLTQLV